MEAVPRLPMISFETKVNTEIVSFSSKLKQYMASFYHEDPDSYTNEMHSLETLRAAAVRPSIDVAGCQLLKKYYCQLHFLKSRFPMEENQPCAVYFSWRDSYSNMVCSVPDIDFELMNILYNIGAVHSKLGTMDTRVTPEGMKMACTHFQCAAWAFQTVRETYPQMVSLVLAPEVIHFMHLTCLAQAQECILEKSMMDNRKATIIAKVAVQVVDYYKKALTTLQTSGEEGSLSDLLGSRTYKDWIKYLNFKVAYHKAIALLYQGQQAEEQQKMGERVAFYQAASDQLQEACKRANNLSHQQEISEALAFTGDVVEGKRKAAKNENEFIYHEDVPDKDALQEVKGASLVKGIAFNVNDVEVSGPDIFARLVPMEAHEASSMYSEKKAQMLRQLSEVVDEKNRALVEFMSSLQVDVLTQMHQATGLTQDLVDRAAAMSARPTAVQDLVSAMGKLSNIYHDVEATLGEIDALLKEEEKKEADYQMQMGTRPPSIIATDLTREFTKYQEAHSKASDSNQNLHRAMTTHVANLKTLSLPLAQLKQQIPSVELSSREIDGDVIREIEALLAKVEEMKRQRSLLWAQLRDAIQNDDITSLLVTRPPEKSLEQLFQQELEKHKRQSSLIEQNLIAQDNILKALVDVYARFTNTRRYLLDVITKRNNTLSALINSYDTYDDLIAKANKGLEFYNKLETNVTKLLQRVKSTCNVQDEEREQMLSKQFEKIKIPHTNAPKLRDYLEPKIKEHYDQGKTIPDSGLSAYPTTMAPNVAVSGLTDQMWPPGVRPSPVGSEMTADTVPSSAYANEHYNYTYGTNPNQSYYNQTYATAVTTVPNTATTYSGSYNYAHVQPNINKNAEQDLSEKMAALMTNRQLSAEGQEHLQQYNTANLPHAYQNVAASQAYPTYNMYQQPTESYIKTDTPGLNYPTNYSTSTAAPTIQPQTGLNYPTNYSTATSSVVTQPQTGLSYPANYSTVTATSVTQPHTGLNYPTSYSTTNATSLSQPQTQPTYSANTYYPYQQRDFEPVASQNYTQSATVYPASNVQQNTSQMYIQQQVGYNQENIPAVSATLQNYGQISNNTYTQSLGNQIGATTTTTTSGAYTYLPNQNEYYAKDYGATNVSTPAVGTVQDYNYQQQYGGQLNQGVSAANNAYGTQAVYDVNSYTEATPSAYYSYGNPQDPINANVADYGSYAINSSINYVPTNTSGYANYSGAINQNVPTISNAVTAVSTSMEHAKPPEKETSNIDLLSGLDFTINQAPLTPQQNKIDAPVKETSPAKVAEPPVIPSPSSKPSNTKLEEKPEQNTKIDGKKYTEKQFQWNTFQDSEVTKLFTQEIEKFEKFVEILTTKTLNGPTPLDLKWKEILDKQEMEQKSRSISVARCYPMKNRFPDILPYDQTRVKLSATKDDYINASYIKDVTPNSPLFIVTQAPTQSTYNDFWTMVWEQEIEIILCLLNDAELNEEVYWPKGQNQFETGNMSIVQQSCNVRAYWTDCVLCINQLEKRSSRTLRLIQFTAWPSSIFPTSPISVAEYVEEILKDQKGLSHPVLIHCLAGIGRSGLFCLLLSAAIEVLINPTSIPDLSCVAAKLSSARKNIIRDREHLKFSYNAFLEFLKRIYANRVGTQQDNSTTQAAPISSTIASNSSNDPLNLLDPLWATKKGT